MAITVVGTAEYGGTGDQSLTPPGGIALDDLVLIFGMKTGSGAWDVGPLGFTLLSNYNTTSGYDHTTRVWYRWATASEPSAYDIRGGGANHCAGMIVLNGVDKSAVIDAAIAHPSQINTATPTAPAVTTVTNGACIIQFTGTNANGTATGVATTDQAGATIFLNQYDIGGTGWTANGCAHYEIQGTFGVYAAAIHTHTGAGAASDGSAFTIALRPSSGSEGRPEARVTQAQVEVVVAAGQGNIGTIRNTQSWLETVQAETASYGSVHNTQSWLEVVQQVVLGNVAYYPEGSRNGSVQETNFRTLIDGWGGTPLEVTSTNLASTSFDWGSYDALAVLHATTGSGGSTATAVNVKRINEDYGVPLYLTLSGWGAGSTGGIASFNPELWGTFTNQDNVTGGVEVNVTSSSTHPIVSDLSTGIQEISGNAIHAAALDSTSVFIGQSLGLISSTVHAAFSTAGQTALIGVEIGPTYLTSTGLTGGRIAGVGPEYDETWNSSGQAFFNSIMDWLLEYAPLPPGLAVTPGSTDAFLAGSEYRHFDPAVPHAFRRYQVITSTQTFASTAIFYDSFWSTDLGSQTVDSLTFNTTGYQARISDQGLDGIAGRWSNIVQFDTLTPTTGIFALSAGLRIDFESSTGIISSLEYLTASSVYVETVAEAISIPANTTKITATAIKRGLEPGVASVKWALIEPGELAVGYHPSPYTTGGGP